MNISIDYTKLMRAGLLLVFTAFLFRLAMTGEMNYLVSPIIAFIVKISIILLAISSLALLKWSFAARHIHDEQGHQHHPPHHDACDCGHNHAPSNSGWGKATTFLFGASLVVAFTWHPKTLGSEMIARAAFNTSAIDQSTSQSKSVQSTSASNPSVSSSIDSSGTSAGPSPVSDTTSIPANGTASPTTGAASSAGGSGAAGGSGTAGGTGASGGSGAAGGSGVAGSSGAGDGSAGAAAGSSNSAALTNPDASNTSAGVVDQQEGTDSQASIAMRFEENPGQYYGKKVTMDGFVYHPPGMPANYFILTRFFVFCCIADASPTGIAVETSDAQNLKSDSWVSVTGTIQPRKLPILNQIQPTNWCPDVADKPVIIPSNIKKIPTPSQPYMFPR